MAREEDDHWWIGDYNGEDCANCGRERVMVCDHPDGATVRVCEKCNWSPDLDRYVSEANS